MDFGKTAAAALDKVAIKAIGALRKRALRKKLGSLDRIWIHFGCGEVNDARFINVEARPFPHVDLITSWPDLSFFGQNTVDLIYACHVFEHFRHAQQKIILENWISTLKEGGTLRLSVPDFEKILNIYFKQNRSTSSIQPYLMGGQDYDGNFHYGVFNKEYLTKILYGAGFKTVTEWKPQDLSIDWPKDYSWEDWISLNLEAIK